MKKYDYLIVGSGLFGSIFAHEATKRGKTCLVIERRNHLGGNIYCENRDGINIHRYGGHIFHTSDKIIWNYINQFAEFNNYINSPIANYKGELYNLPFNMNTFHQMWGVITPAQAAAKIDEQRKEAGITEPKNLEEQAISLIGTDIYEKLIKGYTEKQWGRPCTELPAFIIKRLPVRYIYDNNYFNDRYQGIPVGGYNVIINNLLKGIEVRLNTDFLKERDLYRNIARRIVYTGPIDAYFDYVLGTLEYRGLRFEFEKHNMENYQGVAAVNYTDRETPYTRIIEHKHFEFGKQPVTWITKEYPSTWHLGDEPYYPVNNKRNQELYQKYAEYAKKESDVVFGGRLGDMDKVVASALHLVEKEFE